LADHRNGGVSRHPLEGICRSTSRIISIFREMKLSNVWRKGADGPTRIRFRIAPSQICAFAKRAFNFTNSGLPHVFPFGKQRRTDQPIVSATKPNRPLRLIISSAPNRSGNDKLKHHSYLNQRKAAGVTNLGHLPSAVSLALHLFISILHMRDDTLSIALE
jgi:hypothetical protein